MPVSVIICIICKRFCQKYSFTLIINKYGYCYLHSLVAVYAHLASLGLLNGCLMDWLCNRCLFLHHPAFNISHYYNYKVNDVLICIVITGTPRIDFSDVCQKFFSVPSMKYLSSILFDVSLSLFFWFSKAFRVTQCCLNSL